MPQKLQANEVLEEVQIPKEPQKTPHDTKARTLAQEDIEKPTIDLSQKEKTIERTDKGKGPTVETTSSIKYM